jgi:hypothetical protein
MIIIRYEIESQQRTLSIYNIYNSSLFLYLALNISTLGTLRNYLQESGNDYIIVGDFNLHYLL